MTRYAVITALYNEADNVGVLYERLSAVFENIEGQAEFWFVDDGSTDGTGASVEALAAQDPRVNLVGFSRNFGHHVALFAGLDHADRADFYIMMDGDLQDRPEDIPLLIAKGAEGYDLVYAIRKQRADGGLSRLTSSLFWRMVNFLSDRDIPANQSVFRFFTRNVRDALVQMQERHRFLAGLFSWVGFKTASVEIQHAPRHSGKSKYTVFRQFQQALNAVTGFSVLPLRYITAAGAVISAGSFLFGLVLVVRHFATAGAAAQGWASLMTAIFLSLGILMICMGVIAEYIGKIFQQVQGRPNYIVARLVRGKDAA